MKPCVCGGSNDNCRYCGGAGYVPDDRGLPHPPSDLEKWVPETFTVPARQEKPPFVEGKSGSPTLKEDLKGCFWGWLLWAVFALVVMFLGFLWKSC